METNKLMIGDWVLHDGEPYQIRQLGIYGENRDGEDYPAVCIGKPKGIGLIVERNKIAPITPTPEILEKNGFWYQHNVGFVMEEYEYEVIYDLWNHKLRILKNREQILNLEYFNEMCVHELQHALRLCGIDKEITV